MEEKCKKCGKDLEENKFKKVADWSFCNDCFDNLIDNSISVSAKADIDVSKAKKKNKSPKKEHTACFICEKNLNDKKFKKLGQMPVCVTCYKDLTAKPKIPVQNKKPKVEKPKKKNTQQEVKINPHKIVNCEGCRRGMPERGAILVDGRLLCPDCYYSLSNRSNRVNIKSVNLYNKPELANQQETEIKQNNIKQCDSCGKDLIGAEGKRIEGFNICNACISTDTNFAINVAKKRQKKLMEDYLNNLD